MTYTSIFVALYPYPFLLVLAPFFYGKLAPPSIQCSWYMHKLQWPSSTLARNGHMTQFRPDLLLCYPTGIWSWAEWQMKRSNWKSHSNSHMLKRFFHDPLLLNSPKLPCSSLCFSFQFWDLSSILLINYLFSFH